MKATFYSLIILVLLIIAKPVEAHWVECDSGLVLEAAPYYNSLIISGNNVLIVDVNHTYLSTNNGFNWIQSDLGNIYSIFLNGDKLYAGTLYDGLYLSTNNGFNWTQIDTTLKYIQSLNVNGNNIFAGTMDDGLYFSSDGGKNWIEKDSGLTNKAVNLIAQNSIYIFSITNAGISRSTDNGNTWNPCNNGLSSSYIYSYTISNNNIFLGTNFGVYLSTNNGNNWIIKNTGLADTVVYSLASCGNNIFAGTRKGVNFSNNNANNWIQIDTELSKKTVKPITISNDYIFAATGATIKYSRGVFRAKLSDFGINDVNDSKLSDNSINIYPNPAIDKIEISSVLLNLAANKEIMIYNLLGNMVMKSGIMSEGSQQIDISLLPTGIYFLRIGNEMKMFEKE